MNAPAVVLFTVTDASGVAHRITEYAMAAGRPSGCYVPECGSPVLAASLTTPERTYCRPCRRGKADR
ncbi:MAG: hypothetical protein ACRDTG_13115 [Pseudonocardiaceae bacterium]